MKKVIRLTESDLMRIVRRVIKENNASETDYDEKKPVGRSEIRTAPSKMGRAEMPPRRRYNDLSENDEVEREYEEYEITGVDEIDGKYCKDFEVSELNPGDIIYQRLIDVDENERQWAMDVNSFEPFGLAVKYSSPIPFEVAAIDDNTITLISG